MNRRTAFFLLFSLLGMTATYGQEGLAKDNLEVEPQKNYISISADYLSLGLSYQSNIGHKWYAGPALSGGLGYRFLPGKSIREFDYESGTYQSGHVSDLYELWKLDFNFARYCSQHFNHSAGVYGSWVSPGENKYFAYGLSYGIHYGSKRIKIGHAVQAGFVLLTVSGHPEYNKNAFYIGITPVVVRYTF